MARTKDSPGSAAYYGALQRIFQIQSDLLTGVLPHAGERGSNDEERCKAFLVNVLPRRYSIGSGFIVSSNPGSSVSRQQDVVIYDDFSNSPLHRELSASVFPIEMVYATVEVKGLLQHGDLKSTIQSIGEVRQLSQQCWYQVPMNDKNHPGRFKLQTIKVKRPPRAFIFAYDTSYDTIAGLKNALQGVIDEVRTAHLHGIVVLSKGWFAFQHPNKAPPELQFSEDDALLRFIKNMMTLLQSTVIREAAMSRYLTGIETVEPTGKDEVDHSKVRP